MKIGQAVFQDYQGIRRYGIVEKTFQKDNWKYATVKWFDDESYEHAMSYLQEMRHKDLTVYEYRVDQLKQIDPKKERRTLQKLLDYQKNIKLRQHD